MPKFSVTKIFHFDAGHRVWNHDLAQGPNRQAFISNHPEIEKFRNKCANPHGHTFYVKICFESNYIDEQGMIIDTDLVKLIIKEIEELLDHAFILHKDDPLAEQFLKLFKGYKVVIIDIMPTAEGLAQYIYRFFKEKLLFAAINNVHIKYVEVKISDSVIGEYRE